MYFLIVLKDEEKQTQFFKSDFLNPVLDFIDEQRIAKWILFSSYGSVLNPELKEEDFQDIPAKKKQSFAKSFKTKISGPIDISQSTNPEVE